LDKGVVVVIVFFAGADTFGLLVGH